MKKFSIFILIISSFVCFCCFCKQQNIAGAFTDVSTEIVLPSTYLEFCDLNSPIDVWTDGTAFVIAETNRIVYYDGTFFKQYDLPTFSLSKVSKIGNNIIFLSESKLFLIDTNNETNSIIDSGINSSTYFSISDNTLFTNTSSTIEWRTITNDESGLVISDQISSYNLGFSTNAFAFSNNVLYYSYEGNIYSHTELLTEDALIASSIQNIRGMLCFDENVFVTSATGLYKITTNATQQTTTLIVPITSSLELNTLANPRGFYQTNGKLYICDSTLNAVSEFSINDNAFTNFHITTNHKGSNRISKNANCIFADSNNLYVLDEKRITVYDGDTQKSRTINVLNLENAKHIAVSDNTFLLASSSELMLLKESADTVSSMTTTSDVSQLKNVCSIAVYENYYYILNNEIKNSENIAVLYKLSSNGRTLYKEQELEGVGHTVACDLFGDIYVQMEKNGIFNIYKTNTVKTIPALFASSNKKLLSFYADYEGNLFALKEDNVITKFSPNGNVLDFSINTSANLPEDCNAKGLAIAWGNNKSYLLYDGFILQANSEELGFSTPKMIRIPEDFNLNFTPSPNFVTIKKDAKLFKVNLNHTSNFGEYFDYLEMSSQPSSSEQFVLLLTTDRYSLVANEKNCAIVRSEDVSVCSVVKETTEKTAYIVNDCKVYSQPIIADFVSCSNVTKNSLVKVKSTFTFNNVEFSLIEGSTIGYVASSMLKNDIASSFDATTYTVYTLTNDTKVYNDIMFINEIGDLQKGVQVKVLSIEDSKATILMDGKAVYIDASALKPQGDNVIKNVIIIALLGIGIFISMLFIAKKLIKR